MRAAFVHHSQRYGTCQLHAEVQAQGHCVGRWRIRRVLKAHVLRAQQPHSFAAARTTESGPAVRAAPNRLLGQPAPIAPNRVWVGDITYLPRQGGGWLYLAVWLDRCSRKIVGWDVRETMPEDLVSEVLRRALAVRQPPAGLIVHSDQGSQYTATHFKDLIAQQGTLQSMSRRGNCYDNAHAESFWSRFKAELLDGGSFPGLADAKLEISPHIAYYNAERRHSALNYQSPNHFETQLQTMSQLCPAYLDHLIERTGLVTLMKRRKHVFLRFNTRDN
ncbi:IS3 family transposase [Hymenobacter psychrophilus]|uniref:IS3 family transposase n=1 Tax=Hymenobacter psychrophilus TaxID=651662 RepID=UPI00158711BE|nr:IS3 family transposase [Hymenobacter psychrophilus]